MTNGLALETFLTGPTDYESRQYRVLQGIKNIRGELQHSRLYPSLADLINLSSVLEGFLQRKNEIQTLLPHRLKDVDWENNKLVYEPLQDGNTDLERTAELIRWALPHIKKLIEEGVEVYKFVDEHIKIEHVGLVPMYRDEGYWFVPENATSHLHLLRYEVSPFTSATERYRTLKTRVLESIEQAYIRHSPESIKRRLIRKYREMPNPATYSCDTDLEFPYAETILPVAKRKFMTQVCS